MIVWAKRDGAGGFVATLHDGAVVAVPADPANRHHAEITRRAALDPDDSDTLAVAPADPAFPPPTVDEIYDAVIRNQRVLRAVISSINDGSLAVGANKTGPELKAIIKANM